MEPMYVSIQPVETGKRIKQLLCEQHYTIREIQSAFGFENPQAIYKWISGKSLPSLDNFIILSRLLHTSIENILVIDGDIPRFRVVISQTHKKMEKILDWYIETVEIQREKKYTYKINNAQN